MAIKEAKTVAEANESVDDFPEVYTSDLNDLERVEVDGGQLVHVVRHDNTDWWLFYDQGGRNWGQLIATDVDLTDEQVRDVYWSL